MYAGQDPLSGRELRFRKTRNTEVEAQIELARLLQLARAGRQPDSDVTVAELLDEYLPIAGWDVSTEETNFGCIRRTIKRSCGPTRLTVGWSGSKRPAGSERLSRAVRSSRAMRCRRCPSLPGCGG